MKICCCFFGGGPGKSPSFRKHPLFSVKKKKPQPYSSYEVRWGSRIQIGILIYIYIYTLENYPCPLKRDYFNRKIHRNQPSIFRGQPLVFGSVCHDPPVCCPPASLETKNTRPPWDPYVMFKPTMRMSFTMCQAGSYGSQSFGAGIYLMPWNKSHGFPKIGGFPPSTMGWNLLKNDH